jgi:hypothetical protein
MWNSIQGRRNMTKQLAILMVAGGCILLLTPMVFFNTAEVMQWFPALLIGGGALAFFGIKRYRDA